MQREDKYDEDDYIDDEIEEDDDSCPFIDDLIGFIEYKASTSFLGLPWRREDCIKKFLKARGYKIMERTKDGNKYSIAVKPDEKELPEYSNLRSTFLEEAEDLVVDLMIKFSKNNGE